MDITIDLAKEIVDKFVKNTKREVSIDYIQKVVSEYFQMDVETLQSKTRKRHIVQARQLPCILLKSLLKHRWLVLELKLVNVTMLQFYTHVKQ